MTVAIYSLADPKTSQIRYVGKTIMDLKERLQCHMLEKTHCHKTYWLRSLKCAGLLPEMDVLEIIENSDDEDWQEKERWWIAYLRFLGCPLTNLDKGGRRGKRLSQETKDKIGAWTKVFWTGRKHTPEAKAKMSAAKIGRPSPRKGAILSSETRAKLSAANMGKSPPNKGKPMSEEQKARLSIISKKRGAAACMHTPEAKVKSKQSRWGEKLNKEYNGR